MPETEHRFETEKKKKNSFRIRASIISIIYTLYYLQPKEIPLPFSLFLGLNSYNNSLLCYYIQHSHDDASFNHVKLFQSQFLVVNCFGSSQTWISAAARDQLPVLLWKPGTLSPTSFRRVSGWWWWMMIPLALGYLRGCCVLVSMKVLIRFLSFFWVHRKEMQFAFFFQCLCGRG